MKTTFIKNVPFILRENFIQVINSFSTGSAPVLLQKKSLAKGNRFQAFCEMSFSFSLGEKIRTLFREQGITIAAILTAIGMAIGVLVKALFPGGVGAAASGGGEPPPKNEKGLKEWIRNKLKALASLLGQLGIKAAEALPGIIGGIISWILNRAKDVVGWVSQNLWALVVGTGGLTYTYMVTRK